MLLYHIYSAQSFFVTLLNGSLFGVSRAVISSVIITAETNFKDATTTSNPIQSNKSLMIKLT